ncbi:hypothetical protein SMUE_04710 [Enterococcus cecorum]
MNEFAHVSTIVLVITPYFRFPSFSQLAIIKINCLYNCCITMYNKFYILVICKVITIIISFLINLGFLDESSYNDLI